MIIRCRIDIEQAVINTIVFLHFFIVEVNIRVMYIAHLFSVDITIGMSKTKSVLASPMYQKELYAIFDLPTSGTMTYI